jgi:hypothetical protein
MLCSFRQRAFDRYQLCSKSKQSNRNPVFVSYFTGLESRSLETYLQNLFCAMFGTTILYPFSFHPVQELLYLVQPFSEGYVVNLYRLLGISFDVISMVALRIDTCLDL